MSSSYKANFFKDTEEAGSPTLRGNAPSVNVRSTSEESDRRNCLKKALRSSLLPTHTLLFASNDAHKSLLEILVKDDKDLFKIKINALDVEKEEDYEVLKELLILSALLGSKNALDELKKINILVDSEVLNMAIWSGKFEGNDLRYFTNKVTPTYNSIRHAILSGKASVLEQVLATDSHLRLTSEHIRAVDTVKIAAEKSLMQTLFARFGVTVNPTANSGGHAVSAGAGIEDDSKETPSFGSSM